MGKALAIYRIYPEENYDLAKIIAGLGKLPDVRGVQREPIAFGLEVVKIGFLIDDKTGDVEGLEKKMRGVKGVKDVESVDVTLIS
jgi:translation elongation factor EF-1beta